MPFVKLDCKILYSSIWAETPETKTVWITMLALADQNGIVPATAPGISIAAVVSLEDTRKALAIFESPDPDSKSLENNGKRVERTEGGYRILNYEFYRGFNYSMKAAAIKKRRQRARSVGDIGGDNVPTCPGHSASASASTSDIKPIKKENKEKKENIECNFETFWESYPRHIAKAVAKKAFLKISPDSELLSKILAAIEIQKKNWSDPKYIPHPSTWLNQERWNDEPENFGKQKPDCRTVSNDFSSDEEIMRRQREAKNV